MNKPKVEISRHQYLQALGLFTLAVTHYAKSREAELAIGLLIGHSDPTYLGLISDAIYENADVSAFDSALEKEGFVVADRPEGTAAHQQASVNELSDGPASQGA